LSTPCPTARIPPTHTHTHSALNGPSSKPAPHLPLMASPAPESSSCVPRSCWSSRQGRLPQSSSAEKRKSTPSRCICGPSLGVRVVVAAVHASEGSVFCESGGVDDIARRLGLWELQESRSRGSWQRRVDGVWGEVKFPSTLDCLMLFKYLL
jgi:hypothetical protein